MKIKKSERLLKEVAVGETLEIGEYEFIILEHTSNGTAVLLKNCLAFKMPFDKYTGNWKESSLRKYLNNEFATKIENEVGCENLLTHNVNLITDDGLTDYGTTFDKVSLLTTELYRKYRYDIGENLSEYWWTCTAETLTSNYVKCISPLGVILNHYFFNCTEGVRPFCVLNSNMFVYE